MEDGEMIVYLQQRRESVLGEIGQRYGRRLTAFARCILPTTQDAEECVNDVLLDLWNTIPPGQPESLLAYALMLARRRAVDKLRHMTAKKRGGGVYQTALEELEDCISGESGYDEEGEEIREALNCFLADLPTQDRLLFVGRYFAMESIENLAGSRRISKNTVNIRLSRMRKKLKAALKERSIFL